MTLHRLLLLALAALLCGGGMARAQEAFTGPRRTAREVLALPVGKDRFVMTGTVIHAHSSLFVIQDATGAAFVVPPAPLPVVGKYVRQPFPQPGDIVEVEATRGTGREYSPELYDARWRVTGQGTVPDAVPISMSEALTPEWDGRRVRIRGYVVDYEQIERAGHKVSRLWLRFGETVTYGNVVAPEYSPQPVEKGALVELEGVCSVNRVAPNVVRSFAVHLNSMRDVRAVAEPFSWEKAGALRVALISGGVLALAAAWIFLLRRQVRLRTATIAAREAELRTALAREQELGALKTSFVSLVSHEFRTPLNIIVTSSDILSRYLERLPAEERAEHLASIQSSVKRMSGMMEDVLLLGRFESGMQKFQPEEMELAAWCRRFVDEMQSATSARCPIALMLGDFPPVVRADESLLRHILANLVSNAAKYSAEGATVKLSITRDGGDAVFCVADEGIGIPAADHARLFEAFHRGGNVAHIAGTGLGLVVVKRGVEMHGGHVEFTSEEGRGTTFTVRLPLFDSLNSQLSTLNSQLMPRILIIEDEAQTRRNLATILRMEGYEPLLAADGREGLTVARRERPALILCDVMMPALDGHSVIGALRQDDRTAYIPFIFLTARGERADVRDGMNLGADDYLTKPVTATELLAAIEARLEREQHRPPGEFRPDFSNPVPLESLGLTPREAEVLLWIAQGKTNSEISTILGTSENTVKKHTQHLFEKLGVDTRNAATALAFEKLGAARR